MNWHEQRCILDGEEGGPSSKHSLQSARNELLTFFNHVNCHLVEASWRSNRDIAMFETKVARVLGHSWTSNRPFTNLEEPTRYVTPHHCKARDKFLIL